MPSYILPPFVHRVQSSLIVLFSPLKLIVNWFKYRGDNASVSLLFGVWTAAGSFLLWESTSDISEDARVSIVAGIIFQAIHFAVSATESDRGMVSRKPCVVKCPFIKMDQQMEPLYQPTAARIDGLHTSVSVKHADLTVA